MLVQNTQTLEESNFFSFEGQRYYYKFVCLLRKKDYTDGRPPLVGKERSGEVYIRQWLVSSLDEYRRLLPDMLKYVEVFDGRLYMTADRKDLYKSLINLKNLVSQQLDNIVLGNTELSPRFMSGLANRVSSIAESSSKNGKHWMFDVDVKDHETLDKVIKLCGDAYVCTLSTKSGYHVLARKVFNARDCMLPKQVELKENCLCLLAYTE